MYNIFTHIFDGSVGIMGVFGYIGVKYIPFYLSHLLSNWGFLVTGRDVLRQSFFLYVFLALTPPP